MTRLLRWLLAWLLVIGSAQSMAHDLGVAQLTLRSDGDTVLRLSAKLSTKVEPTTPQLPEGCVIEEQVERVVSRVTQVLEYRIRCDLGLDGTLRLDWQREGALVAVRRSPGEEHSRYLAGRNGAILLDLAELFGRPKSGMQVAWDYLLLGVEHILIGLDHLAFVLTLTLLASGWRLVKLITGFTVGHSLTLILATLGWIRVPIAPVEACIALSIAFVAREAMLPEAERRHDFWLVAGFGLLHGLGFASVLGELGLSTQDLILGLISFNLGVEVGQLLFVAAVLVAARSLRRLPFSMPDAGRWVTLGLGSVALFWTLDRVVGMLA
jgi:hydrogenase/urease accessory protein HupE